jgi:hypothetical protein
VFLPLLGREGLALAQTMIRGEAATLVIAATGSKPVLLADEFDIDKEGFLTARPPSPS